MVLLPPTGYQAFVSVGRYRLKLLSFRNSDTKWRARVEDLNHRIYPFRTFPAKDAQQGKEIALKLAAVYTGRTLPVVVWEDISEANDTE